MSYRQRIGLLALLGGCGLLLLVARAFSLQVLERSHWEELATRRTSNWRPVRGLRGAVVDRAGRPLARDAASFDLMVELTAWQSVRHACGHCGRVRFYKTRQSEARRCRRCRRDRVEPADERNLRPLARLLGLPEPELRARIEREVVQLRRRIEQEVAGLPEARRERRRRALERDYGWRPERIARDVSYEVAREVTLHRARHPAFSVETVYTRRYPGGRPFAHVLGRTRPASRDVMRRDGRTRSIEVRAGSSGIEHRYDTLLQGEAGWVEVARSPRGRRSGRPMSERRPRGGYPVRLTIDERDQRLASSLLGGEQAAFVVVDAATGEVRVLVSAPSYPPEDYAATVRIWNEKAKRAPRGWVAGTPLVERACRTLHVPGSILKPVTAVAALQCGAATPERIIHCAQVFSLHGKPLSWLKCNGHHGDVSLHRALAKSCNIYFQTLLAEMLESERFPAFVAAGRKFGLGHATGIEVEGGAARRAFRFDNERAQGGFIAAAIGQGSVLVSPAQMARAYAGLLTGRLPRLHLVSSVGGRDVSPSSVPLDVDGSMLAAIRAALLDVPRAAGSAAGYGLSQFGIGCKTGTAQVTRGGIHNAWMAGFAPARGGRPPIAFAMVVLNTRASGAEACAPRLRQFFERFYAAGAEPE